MSNVEITMNGEPVFPSWTSGVPRTVEIKTSYLQPSLDPSCAVASCTEQANPLNAIEATLDVFGSPVVRVCLCDEHYKLFGATTEEMPDILIDEE